MTKSTIWRLMTRRKPMPQASDESSKLGKVFGTFDLTALGVSATLGVGVYVLAGHVAKDQAGPSVILSFLIAAAASFLAGLCYAEFSSRVPKSGSAYIFTYVAIGEFMAFIVGWNLILEYVIGAASISKGLSLYIDSLANKTMARCFREIAPINSDFFSSYFDFFSFGGPLLIGLALAFGLSKSARINNVFCVLNLSVVAYVVVAVLYNADMANWRIDPADYVNTSFANTTGKGGFFPFGLSGTLKGAATCFFGFVGFDCIATTGEEVKNPKKTVPRALMLSLVIIFLAYLGVSTLTLMHPYFMLDPEAPLPHAFQDLGWIGSMWVITLGGVLALIASLFGAMFPLPRILYSMALDGLIFREFSCISQRFETPVIATLSAAALTALFAALFDLSALVSMLSIGVLLAYTVVAISIIILRFSHSDSSSRVNECYIETSNLLRPGDNITTKGFVMQLIRLNSSRHPSSISMFVVGTLLVVFCLATFGLSCTVHYSWDSIADGETWALVVVLTLSAVIISICVFISIQPRKRFPGDAETFKVPLVPLLPALSIFINIYLMIMLDLYTWIRFGIWMLLGLFVYYPSAWLYNVPSSPPQMNINNNETSNSPACDNNNESRSVKEVEEDVPTRCDESVECSGVIIQTTWGVGREEEGVIIINELHQTSSSRALLDEEVRSVNDENIAIELLDTILEAAMSDHEENSECIIVKKEQVMNADDTQSLQPLHEVNRDEITAEIDSILERAIAQVAALQNEKVKINNASSDDDEIESENVFKNQTFLSHLNELIAKSSPKRVRESVNITTSKTLSRKKSISTAGKVMLRHSHSFPDLTKIPDDREVDKSFNDVIETSLQVADVKNEQVEKLEKVPTPPPEPTTRISVSNFTATLRKPEVELMKIDIVKKPDTAEKSLQSNVHENEEEDDDKSDEDSVALNRVDIRDKLEKILQSAPSRFSLIAPTPLPRTSVNNISLPQSTSLPPETATPITATMQRQKFLFTEVLKNLKHENNQII